MRGRYSQRDCAESYNFYVNTVELPLYFIKLFTELYNYIKKSFKYTLKAFELTLRRRAVIPNNQ